MTAEHKSLTHQMQKKMKRMNLKEKSDFQEKSIWSQKWNNKFLQIERQLKTHFQTSKSEMNDENTLKHLSPS